MYPYNLGQSATNVLPPQQILQANGKTSIDNLRMSPNSSALIADQTAPIIWKCVSDSLGNVTATAYDITLRKDEKTLEREAISKCLLEINERLNRLENRTNGNDQSSIKRNTNTNTATNGTTQANNGSASKFEKPTGSYQPNG